MSWLQTNHIKRILQPNPNVAVQKPYYDIQMRETNMRGLDPLIVWSNPSNENEVGVITGQQQKIKGAEILQDVLRNNKLRMGRDFISKDGNKFQRELVDQMKLFRKEVKVPLDPVFSSYKVSYTGKSTGKKDDIVVSLQQVLQWEVIASFTPHFRELAMRNGWPI